MSRLRLLCLAALCAAPAFAAPASAASPQNRLVNPGFERTLPGHEWMPAGWDTSRAGLPTVFFGRDTLLAHAGSYSINVANVSSLYPMAHNWSQLVLVGANEWGKDMAFSVWTRTTSLEGRAFVLIQVYRDTVSVEAARWGVDREEAMKRMNVKRIEDPLIALGWDRNTFMEPETDWVRREVRAYVPPKANAVFVRIGMLGTGQILADDASLTVEPARPAREPRPGENLLADPGFEGDGSRWEFSIAPFPGGVIERDTTEAHGGRASLRVSSTKSYMIRSRTGVCQPLSNRSLAGKRLRLTAWVKTDSLKSIAYALLYAQTPRGVVMQPQPQQFGRNTPWTKTQLEMDIPADASMVWAWFCHDAPRPGVVHWDDCSVEVIGKARGPGQPPRRMPLLDSGGEGSQTNP